MSEEEARSKTIVDRDPSVLLVVTKGSPLDNVVSDPFVARLPLRSSKSCDEGLCTLGISKDNGNGRVSLTGGALLPSPKRPAPQTRDESLPTKERIQQSLPTASDAVTYNCFGMSCQHYTNIRACMQRTEDTGTELQLI